MFDARLRPLIDPPLNTIATRMVQAGITANSVTVTGFVFGIGAAVAITQQAYWIAAALIIINRLADGLDGAIARRAGPTDLGSYLDVVLDFLFYALVPLAFAIADPYNNAVAATFLICSFVGTGSSFLAYAIIAEKRDIKTHARGKKNFYYLGGLTEGAETIGFFLAVCIFPDYFTKLAIVFGCLCWFTTATRIMAAFDSFKEPEVEEED